MRRGSVSGALLAALGHVLLTAGAVVMVAPFVLMVSLSLKPPAEIFAGEWRLLPETWYAGENYSAAFMRQPLARYIGNIERNGGHLVRDQGSQQHQRKHVSRPRQRSLASA